MICESEKREERKTGIMFKRSAGVEYRENRVCIFDKTRGEKRREPVPDLCKSGSNEQDAEVGWSKRLDGLG